MFEVDPDIVRTDRCAAAFRRMAWAFVFFLDFRVGIDNVHVDVLPDLIGWLLTASALTALLDLSPAVKGLRTLAHWLVFLSLFDVVEFGIPVWRSGHVTTWVSLGAPLGVISTILNIVLIWRLCGLIMAMAEAVEDPGIWERADSRRRLYLAFTVLLAAAGVMSFAVPAFAMVAVIAGLPVGVIVFCLMMGLMNGTANMCRGAAA